MVKGEETAPMFTVVLSSSFVAKTSEVQWAMEHACVFITAHSILSETKAEDTERALAVMVLLLIASTVPLCDEMVGQINPSSLISEVETTILLEYKRSTEAVGA